MQSLQYKISVWTSHAWGMVFGWHHQHSYGLPQAMSRIKNLVLHICASHDTPFHFPHAWQSLHFFHDLIFLNLLQPPKFSSMKIRVACDHIYSLLFPHLSNSEWWHPFGWGQRRPVKAWGDQSQAEFVKSDMRRRRKMWQSGWLIEVFQNSHFHFVAILPCPFQCIPIHIHAYHLSAIPIPVPNPDPTKCLSTIEIAS